MSRRGKAFDERQFMKTSDFEMAHSLSSAPLHIEYHSHTFCEVLLFLSGNVSYEVEGKTYRLRTGDLVLTNSSELHRPVVESDRPYERYVVWISNEYLHSLGDDSLGRCFDSSARHYRNLLRPGAELLQAILRVLSLLEGLDDDTGYGRDLLRGCFIRELLVYLNRARLGTHGEMDDVIYDEKVSGIINHINHNLGEPLSLDLLAEQFFVSKYHLIRQFKSYTGLTPHQYILKKRLMAARNLLQQNTSATQAAIQCGFSDYSHFSRSFREEYGMSPKAYLK